MKLLSFEHYHIMNESAQKFEQDLNETLNEDIASVITSPIKFIKIKNNAKKYQKALVQQALNDIDLEKKKAASKSQDKPTGVLTAANKAKNAQQRELATNISDRMDDLATTDILKTVATIAKTKAKLAASEIALKAADAVETKELKIKIKKLNQKASDATAVLKNYESQHGKDKKDKTEDSSKEEPKSDFNEAPKGEKKTSSVESSSDEKAPTKKVTPKKEAEIEAAKEKISKQEKKIEELKVDIEESEKEIPQLKADYEKVKGTPQEKGASDELASAAQIIKQNKVQLNKEQESLLKLKEALAKIGS